MHVQSRNPSHERDHAISLMPMARPEGELPIWAGTMLVAAVCALAGLFAVMV